MSFPEKSPSLIERKLIPFGSSLVEEPATQRWRESQPAGGAHPKAGTGERRWGQPDFARAVNIAATQGTHFAAPEMVERIEGDADRRGRQVE